MQGSSSTNQKIEKNIVCSINPVHRPNFKQIEKKKKLENHSVLVFEDPARKFCPVLNLQCSGELHKQHPPNLTPSSSSYAHSAKGAKGSNEILPLLPVAGHSAYCSPGVVVAF